MDDIDRLVRSRDRCLALAATTFLVWQGVSLYRDAMQWLAAPALPEGVLMVAELAGALGWVAATVLFLVYAGRVTKTRSQAVIEDELFQHHKRKAIQIGYGGLMLAIAALFAVAQLAQLPAGPSLRLLVVVGVCTPLFAFLAMGRASEGEA
jgi:hypothetical protein